jgi:hypothetical protein
MSHTNGQAFNYLKKKKPSTQAGGAGQGSGAGGGPRVFTRQMPDNTMHHPPGALLSIGYVGILLGLAANGWQLLTTYTAFWDMFNPNGNPVNQGAQPAIIVICIMMAVSFQFALLMLVFRLDTSWKKHKITGSNPIKETGERIRATAIEIVQHVSLVIIWGALGFVVDTIGDYTFVTVYTGKLDPVTSIFLIFMYAVALYSLATIALVRSLEYVWAGFAAADNLKREHTQDQQGGNS